MDMTSIDNRIKLSDDVKFIISRLTEAGFEAFVVGGCVRDSLLGIPAHDWDITTNAKPYEVKNLFNRTIDTGIEHGTVTVMVNKVGFEVTTYRVDGDYSDGRHPDEISFTAKLSEDLKRRDFTINAMAYNEETGLIDLFDGIKDLENGLIRSVGNPNERFEEDYLRIMRAVRFSAQLGFKIEEETLKAVSTHVEGLANVSWERIRVEFIKTITAPHPEKAVVLHETGIFKAVLPEIEPCFGCEQVTRHHIYDVGQHILRTVMNMGFFWRHSEAIKVDPEKAKAMLEEYVSFYIDGMTDRQAEKYAYYMRKIIGETDEIIGRLQDKEKDVLAITMFFHDMEKPACKTTDEKGVDHFYKHPAFSAKKFRTIGKRLTLDNYTINTAYNLIYWHDYRGWNSKKSVRKVMSQIGKDLIFELYVVQFADLMAQNPETLDEKIPKYIGGIDFAHEVIDEHSALCIKDLQINGNDLMQMGVKKGPEIGRILSKLLEYVLEKPELNDKEKLSELVTRIR